MAKQIDSVVIDGVTFVPEIIAKFVEELALAPANVDCDGRELNVGDFAYVRLSALNGYSDQGLNETNRYGKVLEMSAGFGGGLIGLEFPTASQPRHDLNGMTSNGHGYYFRTNVIRRLS